MKLKIVLILSFTLSALMAGAQLSFPNGPTLNLNTHVDFMYHETGIYFYTGQNKVTDYKWVYNADSLDPRWDFQACMNGDCKVGLPQSGPFVTTFGINDTTGYIKFHVNTFGKTGASRLSYYVISLKDPNDQALLDFYIRYVNNTAINDVADNKSITVYPNPARDVLHVNAALMYGAGEAKLFSLSGQLLDTRQFLHTTDLQFDVSELENGIYILEMNAPHAVSHRMIQISH